RPMLFRLERSRIKPIACSGAMTTRQRALGGSSGGAGVGMMAAPGKAGGATAVDGSGVVNAGKRVSCSSALIAFGVQYSHFRLYPGLDFLIDLLGGQSCRVNQGADGYSNQA